MKTEDLEKNLWNISNALTAYPIGQGVFLSFKFSEGAFRVHFLDWPGQLVACTLLIMNGYMFVRLLGNIHRKTIALDSGHVDALDSIHTGRILGLWMFGVLLPLAALMLPKLYTACQHLWRHP